MEGLRRLQPQRRWLDQHFLKGQAFLKGAWGRLVVFGVAGLIVCFIFLALSVVAMNRAESDDPPCEQQQGTTAPRRTEPLVDAEPIGLELGEDDLALSMGFGRGTENDSITLAAGSPIEGTISIDVTTTALTGDNGAIPARYVEATARATRSAVILDVCIRRKVLGLEENGTFTGSVIFTDERVSPLTVPVTVTAQSRYIWAVAPLVLMLPFVALSVTSATGLQASGQNVKAWIAGVGAAGAVFGAQALANPSWGGPVATFGLIASMYVAATGIAATVGETPASGRRPPAQEGDNEPPDAG
jgi:hypothetical protein